MAVRGLFFSEVEIFSHSEGNAHVAAYLDLSLHESHAGVHFARGNLEVILRGDRHGHSGFGMSPLGGFDFLVFDGHVPLRCLRAGKIELHDRIDPNRLFRDKRFFNGLCH